MKYIYELILENYARYTCLLQSPRLGKFVSNTNQQLCLKIKIKHGFNPLDRGNWYQINPLVEQYLHFFNQGFQSPRSGKFVSNKIMELGIDIGFSQFQSPRSGKFVSDTSRNCTKCAKRCVSIPQIGEICIRYFSMVLVNEEFWCCFNPLDRGNLYQINIVHFFFTKEIKMKTFQSPRSGKFVSDLWLTQQISIVKIFVSIPQIGEICIRCTIFIR